MKILETRELLKLSLHSRNNLILESSEQVVLENPTGDERLDKSLRLYNVMEHYIPGLVKYNFEFSPQMLSDDEVFIRTKINKVIESYRPRIIGQIDNNRLEMTGKKNIFQLVGAYRLALSQKHTRTITEKLGHLLEEIAYISPNCISPENDFGTKLVGVDLLIHRDKNVLIQCQLKSNRNTLTGSQAPRVEKELKSHKNPYFAAALDTNAGWTTGTMTGITRVAGKEFWDLIYIPYDSIIFCLKDFIDEIEDYIYGPIDKKSESQSKLDL